MVLKLSDISPTTTRISKSLKVILPNHGILTVGGGCFWGLEHLFRQYYSDGKGLIDARVGYSNGKTPSPTYYDLKTDTTGHTEALQVVFDSTIVSYKTLIDFFMRIHDPTTLNSQGPDIGSQYRSAIFVHSQEQYTIANQVKESINKTFYPNQKIVTIIEPITAFWDAEEYHQLYLTKNPSGYECPSHYLRSKPRA